MSQVIGLPSPQRHWYPVSQVAKSTPYSATFVRQLARQGKIDATKIGRDWLTTQQSVLQYIQTQQERHKKALVVLQTAERAFLALALMVIIFSATPKAHAQDLSIPPVRPGATISATLGNLAAGWQGLASFYAEELSDVFHVTASSVAEQSNQIKTALLWQRQGTRAALTSLGQVLIGKTPEDYLADAPAPALAIVKQTPHPSDLLPGIAPSASSDVELQQPRVLGLSTGTAPQPSAPENASANPGTSQVQIQSLIDQTIQRYIVSGAFTGPQGPRGPPGPTGLAPGFSGPNGMVQNGNDQTTSVIGGTPIVSYYPAAPSQNFTGTSLAGFGTLSAGTFASGNTTISGNLNVSGPISATGPVTVGSLISSGDATINGSLSATTSTLASLVVSGPATFNGSTTIAGLTVAGFNPGLTPGSIAFQGFSALVQDNANLFYDSINHRLGLGTTTPSQLLTVAGNGLFTGQLAVTGPTVLGTTTIANLTLGTVLPVASGGTGSASYNTNGVAYAGAYALKSTAAGTAFQVLNAGPSGTPTFSSIASLLTQGSNIVISGTSTIAVVSSPSFAGLTVSGTSSMATLTTTGNVGIGSATINSTLYVQGSGNLNPFNVASSSGASELYVATNGNVGIGTITPTQLLEVNGGVKFDSTVQLSSFSAGNAPYINSNSQVGQYILDRNGRPYLRNWQGALGNIGQSTANTVATIIFGPGDSWMSNQFWTDAVQNWLYSQWGRSGLGYVSISSSYGNFNQRPPSGITISESGTWTNTVPGASSPNYCPDLADAVSHDLTGNSTTTLTFSGGITKVVVYYINQPNGASFAWNMDSGAQSGTINTANGSVAAATLTISSLSGTASHTLTFTPTGSGSSGVDICGADAQNPSQNGIHVVNLGYKGTQASTWNAANQTVWQSEIASLNPTLEIVEFGGNEMSANVTPATFNTNLQTVATNIKAAAPNADCLMQSQVDVSIPGATYNMGQYANAMQDAAVASGCAFINTYDNFPSYTVGNAERLYSSPTHLNYSGGEDMARLTKSVLSDGVVYPLISQGSIGGGNLFIGSNVGSVAHTGVGVGNISLSGSGNVIIGSNSMQNATAVAVQNNTSLGASALTAFTSGNSNVAIGEGALTALVSANANTAVGQLSLDNNTGAFNTALGYNAGNGNTSGTLNTYLGFQSGKTGTNNLTYATCVGSDCVPSGSHTVTLGRYLENTIIPGSAAIGTTTVSSALVIQGTTSTASLLNIASSSGISVLYVANSGSVGIGTTSPLYLLQVGSAAVASGTVARFQNANGTCDINPTTNTLACSSDERLKKNITPMTTELSQIMQLQPVYFNWSAENAGTPEHPGFIAQQVQQIMPEVVSTDPETGLLSIGYSELMPAVVSAMQQMQSEITTLQGGLAGNASTSNLTVYNPSDFSGDSVGEAQILAGSTSVGITFSQPYAYQPIVTITAEDQAVVGFVKDKTASGFTIALASPALSDITFDWHSFASPAERLTVSNGTTTAITLVVASQPASDLSGPGQGSFAPAPGDQGASSAPSSGQVAGDSTTTPESSASTTTDSSTSSTPDSSPNAPGAPPSADQSSGTQGQVGGIPTPPTPPSDSGSSPSAPATLAPSTQPSADPSSSSPPGGSPSDAVSSPSDAAPTLGTSQSSAPAPAATPPNDSAGGPTSP
jgi:hypothetical protein